MFSRSFMQLSEAFQSVSEGLKVVFEWGPAEMAL